MSQLYHVFAHAVHGQWGYAPDLTSGEVRTAFIGGRDASVTLESLEPLWVAPAVQRYLRAGFRRLAQQKYLKLRTRGESATGEFVSQHPDLVSDLAGVLLYFAALPPMVDMKEVTKQWECALAATTPVEGRRAWIAHCAEVTSYAPALSADPAAALVLAQSARDRNWILLAGATEALPAGKPSEQRQAWRSCLGQSFNADALDEAFPQLGWPLRESVAGVSPTNPNPAAADPAAWLSIAQQVFF